MEATSGRVIVGYDGSDHAGAAVDWAAGEATRRGVPLTVIYVVELLGLIPGKVPGGRNVFEQAALDVTARGVDRARKTASGIEVSGETHVARPSGMLVEASRDAGLLVLGTRGHGQMTGALLGSVAFAVASHAACPVVVVRGESDPSGPGRAVVVGVDAWPGAEPAVSFAAELAERCGAPLVVVGAYRALLAELDVPDDLWDTEFRGLPRFEEVGRDAALVAVTDARLEVAGLHPDLEVRTEVEEGAPSRVLAGHAEHAGLVVVGDRGEGGFAGLRLGSVSHALLHQAPCPVAVVHLPRPEEE